MRRTFRSYAIKPNYYVLTNLHLIGGSMNRLTKYAIFKYSEIIKNMNSSNLDDAFKKIDTLSNQIGPEVVKKVVNIVSSRDL